MARLAGKVALITGGGTGIGKATAMAFAREGAKVVVADINAAAGDEAAHASGHGAIAIRTDVTNEESVAEAVRRTVDTFGALHILHNNAGGSSARDSNVVEAPLDEFWHVIKLDLFGALLGCRFGIPAIMAAGGGSVINMSSIVAVLGSPGRDCYTAAKGGVMALTRSMAAEFVTQKVRVNAIAPGGTMTDRIRAMLAADPQLAAKVTSQPLGPIEPEDVANMALFLASDESRVITGQIFTVDSGLSCQR